MSKNATPHVEDFTIELVHILLSRKTEGERVLFHELLFENYCTDCGRLLHDKHLCTCLRDE